MYYHTFDLDRGQWGIGSATSANGVSWERQGPLFWGSGNAFDIKGAAAHHVVQDFGSKR